MPVCGRLGKNLNDELGTPSQMRFVIGRLASNQDVWVIIRFSFEILGGSDGKIAGGAIHRAASSEKTSLASAMVPRIAAAATMTGDISTVRPVGEPWRPLKFRFEDEAQS